ncbi:MAG: hypothetical protein KGI57_10315 [Hyphomicrobiales bacterium]|nr:hypothetical protein [Hyphomicrobiales bacterium]
MSDPALRRGWCPSAFAPMESGDGFVLRVRAPRGRLALATFAALSALGADGLEVTRRGNLQLRGFARADVPGAQDALAALGLVDGAARRETPCDIWVSPYAGDDPSARGDALAVHDALAAAFSASAIPAPPSKYAVAIDDGGVATPLAPGVDVTFRVDGDRVTATSSGSSTPFAAGATADAPAMLARALREVARKPVVDGPEAWRPPLGVHRVGARAYVGFQPPFGAVSSEGALRLADAAGRFGVAEFRFSPSRRIVAPASAEAGAAAFARAVDALGFVLRESDPLARAEACVGAPHCGRATTRTRDDARALVAALGDATPALHVSGCAKGCASPSRRAFTLAGAAGRYDLVLDGTPGDAPTARGLALDGALRAIRDVAMRRAGEDARTSSYEGPAHVD